MIETSLVKCYIREALSCISMLFIEKVYKQLQINNVETVSGFARGNKFAIIVNSPKNNMEIPFPFGSGKLLHRFPRHFTTRFQAHPS